MKSPKQILVVDVEATCWENQTRSSRSEIIEIGITPVAMKTYQLGESESILIRPRTTTISEFCTQLTTITQDMVDEHGLTFPYAMLKFDAKYDVRKSIFASWGDYDRKIIEENCTFEKAWNPVGSMVLNVKSLYAAKYGHSGAMNECAAELGYAFEGTHHRGIDDSRMIAKILVHILSDSRRNLYGTVC